VKKIASIILLIILLFNWCGYRWVINLMQETANSRLEARLDRNEYDESQLIEIKVPLSMPYQSDWAAFERYDGEVEVNGIHYKYVKRKIQQGQLVLKCIPNASKQLLESAKEDLFKMNNDLQQEHASKKSGSSNTVPVKSQLSDYDDPQLLQGMAFQYALLPRDYNHCQILLANGIPSLTPEQPPEFKA
jgi:hypothetical protein